MNSSSKNDAADLLIVGAGVAGSAVALECATRLRRIIVLHADDGRQGTESASPHACARLKHYSIDIGEPLSYVAAWWGSDRLARMPCPGARVVQRDELAQRLREASSAKVVMLKCKSILGLTSNNLMWLVNYRDQTGNIATIKARNVCDATGRRSVVGRLLGSRRISLDNLCCAAAPVADLGAVGTWTEAVSNGWWNVCANTHLGTLSFYSTPKILRAAAGDLKSLLAQTRHIRRQISLNETARTRVQFCGSSLLSPCAGPGWFATGDAAMTVQPLASAGISKALRDAQCALRTIDTGGGEYDQRYQQEFAGFSKSIKAQYQSERRWKESEFWKHPFKA